MANIRDVIPIDTTSLTGVPITAPQAGYLGDSTSDNSGTTLRCLIMAADDSIAGITDITASGAIVADSISDGMGSLSGGVLSGVTLATGTAITDPVLNGNITGTGLDTTLPMEDVAQKIPSSSLVIEYVEQEILAWKANPLVSTDNTHFPTSQAVANYVATAIIDEIDPNPQGHIIFKLTSSTGLMVQWGNDNTGGDGDGSVSFNPIFSTTPYSVTTAPQGSSSGGMDTATVIGAPSKYGFGYGGGNNAWYLNWIAIGRINI